MAFEYRVIPAPKRLKRKKGVSNTTELFAMTLTECINAEAQAGWEYVRAESLSAEEPGGFFRRATVVEETMLIFRRPTGNQERTDAAQALGVNRGLPPRQNRSLSGLFGPEAGSRGEPSGRAEPDQRQTRAPQEPSATPLLRPVPRHKPNDRS